MAPPALVARFDAEFARARDALKLAVDRGSDMRVLIADDDVTSRLMLEAIVSKLGHECLVAHDGSRAWEMLSSEVIDVLLTDWLMPGVDGPELCRRVRHELNDRYTYIVLVTRIGQPELVLEGMGAGADDYLIKPADPFAVKTRLVAAERVTALHRQLVQFPLPARTANLELLGQSLTDAAHRPGQPSPYGRRPGARVMPGHGGSVEAMAWPCST